MRPFLSAVSVLVFSSPFAAAQSVLFQDGFESGFAQWTATGFWNQTLSTDTCGSLAAPFPEGDSAGWYGISPQCNFDSTQFFGGNLTLNTWVTLPSNVASVSLYFKSFVDSEYCWGGWDINEVQVIAQGGPDAGFVRRMCATTSSVEAAHLTWHERRVDLSAYRGAQVRVAFRFQIGDTAINDGLGWLVDDVRIIAEPGQTFCPIANPFNACPCDTAFGVGGGCFNAQTKTATLISSGVASVAADSLAFVGAEMPPGTAATLFQGSASQAPAAFGDGLLCVTGTLIRLGTRFAPTGSIDWPMPNAGSISAQGFVAPTGGDYFYQAMYRDSTPTHCTSATFNLTSAQKVTWTP